MESDKNSVLPDFMAKLKADLATLDGHYMKRIGTLEYQMGLASDIVLREKIKNEIEGAKRMHRLERDNVTKNWQVWKASTMQRHSDIELLSGRGLLFQTLQNQVTFYKGMNPDFDKDPQNTFIGYCEIHQWHDDHVKRGETKFGDVYEANVVNTWWRKMPNVFCSKASKGCMLYGIQLGGLLHFLDHNADSSD